MVKVIVCGYGIVDSQLRTPVEMIGLQNYYKGLYEFMQNLMKTPSDDIQIIFTGGHTNPKSTISEAASAKDYFLEMFLDGIQPVGVQFLLEECSETTAGNIVRGFLTGRVTDSIIIVCDTNRKTKVEILAASLFGNKVDVSVLAFERQDIHPNSNYFIQSTIALLKEFRSQSYQDLRDHLYHSMSW